MRRCVLMVISVFLALAPVLMVFAPPAQAAPASVQQDRLTVIGSPGSDIYDPGSQAGWRYGPSLIVNDDGSVDMWSCSPGSGGAWDFISYRHSTDGGLTWSADSTALQPNTGAGSKDIKSTCDPGVFKIGAYYFLTYTSTVNPAGMENQVFVARSTQPDSGFQKWNGSGWGGNPEPIVSYTGPSQGYGVGESSVVVNDGQIYLYYTYDDGHTQQTRLTTASAASANWPADLTYQGIAIAREGEGPAVVDGIMFTEDSTDIKYIDDLDLWVGVSVGNRLDQPDSFVKVYQSTDGMNFTSAYFLRGETISTQHNIGITGDAQGHLHLADDNFIAYAYGTDWGKWKTRRSPIDLSVEPSGTYASNWGADDSGWTVKQGSWSRSQGEFTNAGLWSASRIALGEAVFGNATYSATVKINSSQTNSDWAGMLVGGQSTSDSYLDSGYLVYLRANGQLSLLKAGVGDVVSNVATGTNPKVSAVRLRVVKGGDTISVYVNNSSTSALTWHDTGRTWDSGYLSLISYRAMATYTDAWVTNNVRDTLDGDFSGWTASAGNWGGSNPYYCSLVNTNDPAVTTMTDQLAGDGRYDVSMRAGTPAPGKGTWVGMRLLMAEPDDKYYESGYTVFLRPNGAVSLYKAGSGVVVSDMPTGTAPSVDFVDLTVAKHQENIQVFVNGSKQAVINYDDPAPLNGVGYLGLSDVWTTACFDDVSYQAQG